MLNAKKFLEAVTNQRHQPDKGVDEFLRQQQNEWINDLSALRHSIREWMGPIVEASVAKLNDADFELADPDLGSYAAPGLEIVLILDTDRRIRLRPRGLEIVGIVDTSTGKRPRIGATAPMRGRVDLECGVKREILARIKKGDDQKWSWYSFAGGKERLLNEDVFFELLAKIAGVPLR